MNSPQPYAFLKIPFSVFVGAVVFELGAILLLNGGMLVYSIDDPYIHLALAEMIWNGHYGVNPGEFSSPSSSIIWPFILALFSSLPAADYSPLLLNVVAAIVTLIVFAKIINLSFPDAADRSRESVRRNLLLVSLLATNIIGLIFNGMEHSVQLLCTALVVYGLLRVLSNKGISWWFIAAIIAGPLVRYENLAISVAALLFLFTQGHRRTPFLILPLLLAPLIGFSLFLIHLGLDPFPASVVAKSEVVGSSLGISSLLANISGSLLYPQGLMLIAMLPFLCLWSLRSTRPGPEKALAAVTLVAILLHIAFGRYDAYGRYEVYIWVFALFVVTYLSREQVMTWGKSPTTRKRILIAIGATILCSRYIFVFLTTPVAANNIYEQQYQMHRFATEFHKGPVAVNDLGWVSYKNPHYVLDLWGLASPEALRMRHDTAGPEWMDRLARKHGVKLAMIYGYWFPQLPETWTPLAQLHLGKPRISPADATVTFYATDPDASKEIGEQLIRFRPTLPPGVTLDLLIADPNAVK